MTGKHEMMTGSRLPHLFPSAPSGSGKPLEASSI